jgi:hypothetical protein
VGGYGHRGRLLAGKGLQQGDQAKETETPCVRICLRPSACTDPEQVLMTAPVLMPRGLVTNMAAEVAASAAVCHSATFAASCGPSSKCMHA